MDDPPIWIGELELGESLVPTGVSRPRQPADAGARLLVRLHRQVLGLVSVSLGDRELDASRVGAAVLGQLGEPLRRHLESEGRCLPEELSTTGLGGWDHCTHRQRAGGVEPITVVICTRDRPGILRACLLRVQRMPYPEFEVVVVDNAPTSEDTALCFASIVGDDHRFRYVREPVPGLSRARNRGLAEATTRRVAFTDDDVKVDAWWLDAIAAGFDRDPRAGCVTGLVPPAELEHPGQQYFDRRFSWSRHLEPRIYDMYSRKNTSVLYPYSAGIFGTGANFAVDRQLLIDLGGFDEALGAGTPAGGGEDLDAFVRILRAQRSVVYEPSAVVWHHHRADPVAQRRQLFTYGTGLTAFLTKYLANPRTAPEILSRVPEGARRLRKVWRAGEIGGRAPAPLIAAEALGMVVGPLYYLRGRQRLRRVGAVEVTR